MSRKKRGTHVVQRGIRKRYRADGTVRGYEVRYRDPERVDLNGKPILRCKTFRTRDEAESFQARTVVEILDGEHIDPERLRTKWKHISDEWLRVKEAKGARARTVSGYRNVLDNWLSHWDKRAIDDIRPADVWAVIEHLRGKGRAVGTERHVFNTINGVFKYAVRKGYVRKNPAEPHREDLRGQTDGKFEGKALTAEEAEAIIGALPAGRFRLYGLLGLWTGFRAGELAGLRVSNLDSRRSTVQVGETVEDLGGTLRPGTTKTQKSRGRRVPIPQGVMDELTTYIEARGLTENGYLFAGPNEYFRHSNFYKRQWRAACEEAGLPGTRFHTLRHTFLSLRAREGVPPNVLMEWAGHSTIKVTMDVYTHAYEDDPRDREMVERMFADSQQRAAEHRAQLTAVNLEAG